MFESAREMITSGFKVKARTVNGGRNFCCYAFSLTIAVYCHHGNVLYFVSMFCTVPVKPCLGICRVS